MLRFWAVASVFLTIFFLGRVGRMSPGSKTSSGKSKLFRVRAHKATQKTEHLLAHMNDRQIVDPRLETSPGSTRRFEDLSVGRNVQ